MTFDIFVFTQQELNDAVLAGHTSIGLCDNEFIISPIPGITYIAIGSIKVYADAYENEFENIRCIGFTPIFTKKNTENIKPLQIFTASVSSYLSSYFMSSYFMTSYHFMYEYEYEYETGSFVTSYLTSYTTSFLTSYTTSYTSSFISSYLPEYKENECILVNGYGIHLI